mmetsp:Transcript_130763/g.260880  ORF Transcript_130763/g.260880 Transcript_130763/m.260880 type:complete len:678 (+) Transcript_130763:86-2119(+)
MGNTPTVAKWYTTHARKDSQAMTVFRNAFPKKPHCELKVLIFCSTVSSILSSLAYSVTDSSKFKNEFCALQKQYSWFRPSSISISSGVKASFFVVELKVGKGIDDVVTFLIIRGTDSAEDWEFNASTEKADFRGARKAVHSGFDAFSDFIPLEMIKKHVRGMLVVAGHSLGGAAAEMAVLKQTEQTTDLMVITFGQPNVFAKELLQHSDRERAASVVRFFFANDPVPGITHNFGCEKACEHLVELTADANMEKKEEVPILGNRTWKELLETVSDPVQNHSMDRYKEQLLRVVQMSGGDDGHDPEFPEQAEFCISKCNVNTNYVQADGGEGSCRFKLKIEGDGENVGFVAADIKQHGEQLPGHSLQSIGYYYVTNEFIVDPGPGSPPITKQVERMVWEVVFDVTDVNFKSNELTLFLTNGFQKVTKEVKLCLQNVAVIGVPGAGKSHLVRGLKAIARREPIPTVQPIGASRATAAESEQFTEGKITYYEIAGVLGKDMTSQLEVHHEFWKKPPKVLILVWKYGDKEHPESTEGLKAFFGSVRANLDKNEIRVMLALTNCVEGGVDWDNEYDIFARQVLTQLSLPQQTCFFKVNSAQMTSVQPRGLKELHDRIMGIMAQDPSLKNAFQLIPIWKRIMGDSKVQGAGQVALCAAGIYKPAIAGPAAVVGAASILMSKTSS